MREDVALARVSKREQAEDSHALEQQIARLEAEGISKIYVDIKSGKSNNRLGLKQLLANIEAGTIRSVTVTRLDRLARMAPSKLWKILNLLEENGVALKALDQQLDTSTAAGRFQINVLSSVAAYYIDDLSERVKHGWQHLRNRKVAMNPPFGYCKVNDRHELDRQEFLCLIDGHVTMSRADIARDVVDIFLYQSRTLHSTVCAINEKYGLFRFNHGQPKTGFTTGGLFQWSVSGLKNWLTNPVLCGHLAYLRNKEPVITYNTHPDHRLISDDEAREIEEIIAHNRNVRGWGTKALKYPLSGLVFCRECGGACYSLKAGPRNGKQRQYAYFTCKNYRVRACNQKQSIRMELCEAAVQAALKERAEVLAEAACEPDDVAEPPELLRLRSDLAGLRAIGGKNPAIVGAIASLENQIEALQLQLQDQPRIDEALKARLTLAIWSDKYWESYTDSERRELYRALVERVVVRRGEVVEVRLKV